MAYSTGSGDYIAMMAAVRVHAVADGWTDTAGNWPISKGNVRGVDWSSFTTAENDFTGTLATPIVRRTLRIAIGTSTANATANAAITNNSALATNVQNAITAWHIYSNSGAGLPDYISVVYQFTNLFGNSDCYGHFSFGEIQKDGLTYNSIAYAGGCNVRSNAANTSAQAEWSSPDEGDWMNMGSVGEADGGTSWLQTLIHPTTPPVPVTGGWPQPDNLLIKGASVLTMNRYGYGNTNGRPDTVNATRAMNSWAWAGLNQPFSGAITLGVMPMILMNGSISTSTGMWVGVFPGTRMSRIDNYQPGDEVVFGGETWQLFPILRSTDDALLAAARTITSGRLAYAYRKVV